MDAAQIGEPPSASKLDLIKRFLVATGLQRCIDEGAFLEQFAVPGGSVFAIAARIDGATLKGTFEVSMAALKSAYAKHRAVWQREYEDHANWEFTEAELREIVAFLEAPTGQHFLEGRWRMDAYIRTNTESLAADIVKEAEDAVSGH